jgi:hypothetical protein
MHIELDKEWGISASSRIFHSPTFLGVSEKIEFDPL